MKRLLSLILCLSLVLCFAACGGGDNQGNADAANGGGSGNQPTSVKFAVDSYAIGVGETKLIKNEITVEPAGAAVTYSSADASICTVDANGKVVGVKAGTTTVTAGSADGSVKATCTVTVVAYGTVIGFEKGYAGYKLTSSEGNSVDGGIRNKRPTAPEMNLDPNAKLVFIPVNMEAGVDMFAAAGLNYGSENDEGWYYTFHGDVAGNKGYVVAKTHEDNNSFEFNLPEGDYYVLIVSSYDNYANYYDYASRNTVAELKSSAIGKWFTDSELSTLSNKIGNHLFSVITITVKAGEKYYFEHLFAVN